MSTQSLNAEQLTRGVYAVEIEGVGRELRLGLGALRHLQDRLKAGTLRELVGRLQVLDAEACTGLVWAGLQHEPEPPTFEDVEAMFIPLGTLVVACQSALNLAVFGHPEGMARPGGSEDTEDPPKIKPRRPRKKSNGSARSSASATGPG